MTTTTTTLAERLRVTADHFESSRWAHPSTVLTEIHGACQFYGATTGDYAHNLDVVLGALADEAGCDIATLSLTLEALNVRTELPGLLRRAAKRVEEASWKA